MNTQHLQANSTNIQYAAEILQAGGLVAFPTETVYGLGACVFNETAVSNIFTAKQRPPDNPLIVHCAEKQDVKRVACDIPPVFDAFFARFCPGALTFILPSVATIPNNVTAGLSTVALRFPDNAVALELIRAVGEPLVAPSANRSGYPSPTTAAHVLHDLNGRVDAVLDGGECTIGIESTVISFLVSPPRILRPGSITKTALDVVAAECGLPAFLYAEKANLAEVRNDATPISPGTKYRHYAPLAQVILTDSLQEAERIRARYKTAQILASPLLSQHSLYAQLRRADDCQAEAVIVVCDSAIRADVALMNRLEKAASAQTASAR
jgi:L-threonylcarbamoyladenylate synthase